MLAPCTAVESHLLYLCAQSCLTLCDPMDYSPPGFSVCGIFQARILEWVVISFSGGSSPPRVEPLSPVSPALQWVSLPDEPLGKPNLVFSFYKSRGKIRLPFSCMFVFLFFCFFFFNIRMAKEISTGKRRINFFLPPKGSPSLVRMYLAASNRETKDKRFKWQDVCYRTQV